MPDDGPVAFFGLPGVGSLASVAPERATVVQSFYPDHDAWAARGVAVHSDAEGPFAASIVTLPRARDWAEALLAKAEAATPGGLVIIDGAKTDGVDAILKALRTRVALEGPVSKAHGKVAWFRAADALTDWARPAMHQNAAGDWVAPGVFSADGADPGSQALAAALPASLKGVVADLGAGWGWLSREILKRPGVAHLFMVEAEGRALACAGRNVDDPRAAPVWADATWWMPPEQVDTVIMNPPFHTGRQADPSLGRAFIAAAAGMLKPSGSLWLVANRHLPYEAELTTRFAKLTTAETTARFKILHATRPLRAKRRP